MGKREKMVDKKEGKKVEKEKGTLGKRKRKKGG